jgi:hypothetical protein
LVDDDKPALHSLLKDFISQSEITNETLKFFFEERWKKERRIYFRHMQQTLDIQQSLNGKISKEYLRIFIMDDSCKIRSKQEEIFLHLH